MTMRTENLSLASPTRRHLLAAAGVLAGGTLSWPVNVLAAAAGAAVAGSPDDEALHLLDRLAFGPAPGDLDRVRRAGAPAWIEQQLHPETLPLPAPLQQQLASFTMTQASPRELVQRYRQLEQQAKRQQAAMGSGGNGGNAANADAGGAPQMPRQRGGAGYGANGQPGMEDGGDAQPGGGGGTGGGAGGKRQRPAAGISRRDMILRMHFEAGSARLLRAIWSPRQLEEVMVDFWFNHFNVFDGKGLVRVLVEDYEEKAIRPHVLGRFRDMLGDTARHPAMLFYLDNWLSVGPDYRAPPNANRQLSGLNENYARELMELHTLGVDGGYTQKDVTELARMLTGWTFDPHGRGNGSLFVFDPARHDNGTKTWLGKTVGPRGQAEGEFALDELARHPATARHIAFKLGQRFVADQPPPALVDRVAKRFLASDGDIRATLKELFDSPEFRSAPAVRRAQFKTPYEYVISAVRASGIPATNMRPLIAALSQLGQPLYGCQTPDGYAHTQSAWLNPDAVTRRVNFATALASGRMPLARAVNPDARNNGMKAMEKEMEKASGDDDAEVAGSTPPVDENALLATLGPAIAPATRATIAQSAPNLRAALVLGSPDFMKR